MSLSSSNSDLPNRLNPTLSAGSYSQDEINRITQVTSEFEHLLRTGKNPSIETYLESHADGNSRHLLIELLRVELEFACQENGPTANDAPPRSIWNRYPAYQQEIESVWNELQMQVSVHPHQSATQLPTKIGSFELLEKIGQGAMGMVFRARDTKLKRLVALKLMRSAAAISEDEQKRFQLEAEAAARLRHNHIVQIYDVGEDQGIPYIAMELVQGTNLLDFTSRQPINPRLAAKICRDLANAIAHAHQFGIVHRDLKPGNILIADSAEPSGESGSTHRSHHVEATCNEASKDSEIPESGTDDRFELATGLVQGMTQSSGLDLVEDVEKSLSANSSTSNSYSADDVFDITIKVSDFGLAKIVDSGSEITGTGAILGTPQYMAPEQAGGGAKNVGPPADVYAIGGVLYYLLTGKPPFSSNSPVQTIMQVVNRSVVAPSVLVPGTPRDLETICIKCLEKDSAKRVQSAREVASELDRFLNGEPILSRPISRLERTWRWCRRHKAVASLLTACFLILIVGLSLVTWKWRESVAAQRELQIQQARFLFDRALEICEDGKPDEGVHWMVAALETSPGGKDQEHWEEVVRRNIHGWMSQLDQIEHSFRFGNTRTACSALSPDGTMLVIGLWEGGIVMYDTETGKQLHETQFMDIPKTGWSEITSISFHPDGTEFVCTAKAEYTENNRLEGLIQRFSSKTGKPISEPRRFPLAVFDAVYIKQGDAVLIGCGDAKRNLGFVQRLDVESMNASNPQIQAPGSFHNLALSDDESILFVSFSDAKTNVRRTMVIAVNQWQQKTLAEIEKLKGTKQIVIRATDWYDGPVDDDMLNVTTSHTHRKKKEGNVIPALDRLNRWTVEPLATGVILKRTSRSNILLGQNPNPDFTSNTHRTVVAYSPNRNLVSIGNHAGILLVKDVETNFLAIRPIEFVDRVMAASFDRTGDRIAAGSHRARIWDTKTGEALTPWMNHASEINAIEFSPDGKILATGDYAFEVRLWNTKTGEQIGPPLKQNDIVMCMAFSPDGQKLAVGTAVDWNHDPQIRIWNVATGEQIGQPMRHGDYVQRIQFTTNGDSIISVSSDSTAQLWDASTTKPVGPPFHIAERWGRAQISPDGSTLLAGSDDGRIQLWDIESATTISGKSWVGNRAVTDLQWSSNGERFVVGFEHGETRIFDAENVVPLGPPTTRRAAAVKMVHVNSTGSAWMSVHHDGMVFKWTTPEVTKGSTKAIRTAIEAYTTLKLDENQALIPLNQEQVDEAKASVRESNQPLSFRPHLDPLHEFQWQRFRVLEAEYADNQPLIGRNLEWLLEREPKNVNLRLRQARYYSNSHQFEKADGAYREIQSLLGDKAKFVLALWYYQRSYETHSNQQHDTVLWYLDRLETIEPLSWQLLAIQANTYWRTSQSDKAKSALLQALELSEENRFKLKQATTFAQRHHDYSQAAEIYQSVAMSEPLSFDQFLAWSIALLNLDDEVAQQTICSQICAGLDPNQVSERNIHALVRIAALNGGNEKEKKLLIESIDYALNRLTKKQISNQQRLLFSKAAIQLSLGQTTKAKQTLLKARDANQSDGTVREWILFAAVYSQTNNQIESQKYLDRIKVEFSDDSKLNFWLRKECELLLKKYKLETNEPKIF